MKAGTDELTIIRPPMAGRIGGTFVTSMAGAISIFLLGGALIVIGDGHVGAGIFTIAIAGFTAVLTRYVFRDVRAKWGWRIAVGADGLDLDLPRGRSLIHRLNPVHRQVRYDQIDTVETRLEAYRSFGMANMHRGYALRLRNRDLILLGEDRALGTDMASSFLADTVARIVQRGRIGTLDLGMAEGKGGILSVLFTSPPPWDTPGLGDAEQASLWRRVAWTGALGLVALAAVLFAAMMIPAAP